MGRRACFTAGLCCGLIYLLHGPSEAHWPATGRAVSSAFSNDTPEAVLADQAGGVIVSWIHYPEYQAHPQELRIQRIDANGIPRWGSATDGFRISSSDGLLGGSRLVLDPEGGCYLAWVEDRPTTGLYLLRLDAQGSPRPGWPTTGLRLGNLNNQQSYFDIASDQQGGVFAVWQEWDFSSGPPVSDLLMTRVRPIGDPAAGWSLSGRAICAAPGMQDQVSIIEDGLGGIVACWRDTRADAFTPQATGDVYALRVTRDGTSPVGWPPNGIGVGVAPHEQNFPVLVPDGTGGAIVSWWDSRADSTGIAPDVYAARVDGSGTRRWGTGGGGIPVADTPEWQGNPIAVSDSLGGAFFVWPDARPDGHVYASHFDDAGATTAGWGDDGSSLFLDVHSPFEVVATSDRSGGLYVAWDGVNSIRMKHLRRDGTPATGWSVQPFTVYQGSAVCSLTEGPIGTHSGSIATSANGTVFVCWSEFRDGPQDSDVFVSKVSREGRFPQDPPPGTLFLVNNPVRRAARFRFRLPSSGVAQLEIYDLQGRRQQQQVIVGVPLEETYETIDLKEVSPGIYLARCVGSDGTTSKTVKMVLIESP